MKATSLGDFEELVLMSVCILDVQAYAVGIKMDLEERLKKSINISAIHTALYRLEDKNFLTSKMEGATAERGGRRKRYFMPTSAGEEALARLKALRYSMYEQIPGLSNA